VWKLILYICLDFSGTELAVLWQMYIYRRKVQLILTVASVKPKERHLWPLSKKRDVQISTTFPDNAEYKSRNAFATFFVEREWL
jgi:hypothetical protein